MSQQESFEALKKKHIDDTEAFLAQLKSLSFDDLFSDKAGHILTDARNLSVTSSIQLFDFVTNRWLQHFTERVKAKKLI